MTEKEYRELIVQSGLRMADSGLTVESWGNISARDPETGLVYITPSSMKYESIREEDGGGLRHRGAYLPAADGAPAFGRRV